MTEINTIFTKPIEFSIDDDVMPLSDWLECVKDGSLIDYDGYGRAYNLNLRCCTKEVYHPSEYKNIPEGTTHIIWYNR